MEQVLDDSAIQKLQNQCVQKEKGKKAGNAIDPDIAQRMGRVQVFDPRNDAKWNRNQQEQCQNGQKLKCDPFQPFSLKQWDRVYF